MKAAELSANIRVSPHYAFPPALFRHFVNTAGGSPEYPLMECHFLLTVKASGRPINSYAVALLCCHLVFWIMLRTIKVFLKIFCGNDDKVCRDLVADHKRFQKTKINCQIVPNSAYWEEITCIRRDRVSCLWDFLHNCSFS